MEKKKLHWGIIGCGNVTEKKSGPAFYRLPECALVAVMRRDAEKAAGYAVRHGVKKYYADAASLIDDPEVEAVYIATPPSSHAELTVLALEKGKPVYVEKPMATTYAECLAMVEASRRAGMPLYVAYYRRAMEYFKKVKQLVSDNALGKIGRVALGLRRPPSSADKGMPKPWRLEPAVSGGGYFVDMGAHQLDLLQFLFGSIERQESVVTNRGGWYEAEDRVDATFYFASGIVAHGTWDFAAPDGTEDDFIEITGESGSLYFSTFSMVPIRLVSGKEEKFFPIPKPEVVEEPMIGQITQELLTGHYSADALVDAVETTRLIEEILKPYYARRRAAH